MNEKIEVYKIEVVGENKPLYSKLDNIKQAFDFLEIGYLGTQLIIKKIKIDQWEFDALPEHNGF